MNIAVIPARGGSKRIPGKNIKNFCGRPMIAWAIETAKNSNLFDHIIVSTDDEEIADIAMASGAEVPFMRPSKLADDFAATVPVIAHAAKACKSCGWEVEYICCIYPCTPLLQTIDLVAALDLLKKRDVDYVYPVTEYAHPIQRAMRRLANGQMQFITPQYALGRTQDMEKTYHDAGQFYWGKTSAWLDHKEKQSNGFGMPIPSWKVVDIDTVDDWKRAEILFKMLRL